MNNKNIIIIIIFLLIISCATIQETKLKSNYKYKWFRIFEYLNIKYNKDEMMQLNSIEFNRKKNLLLKLKYKNKLGIVLKRMKSANNQYNLLSDRWKIYFKNGKPLNVDTYENFYFIPKQIKKRIKLTGKLKNYNKIIIWEYGTNFYYIFGKTKFSSVKLINSYK